MQTAHQIPWELCLVLAGGALYLAGICIPKTRSLGFVIKYAKPLLSAHTVAREDSRLTCPHLHNFTESLCEVVRRLIRMLKAVGSVGVSHTEKCIFMLIMCLGSLALLIISCGEAASVFSQCWLLLLIYYSFILDTDMDTDAESIKY